MAEKFVCGFFSEIFLLYNLKKVQEKEIYGLKVII